MAFFAAAFSRSLVDRLSRSPWGCTVESESVSGEVESLRLFLVRPVLGFSLVGLATAEDA